MSETVFEGVYLRWINEKGKKMIESPLRLIKKWNGHLPKADVDSLPVGLRGIYVLYKHVKKTGAYNVVYVGMSASGKAGHMKRRVRSHRKYKSGLWTHFSIFEVWDNIRNEEIKELEGLFREIYRKDSSANKLNVQRGYKKLKQVESII